MNPMKSVPVKTCTNIDCPERTGGNCNAGESVPVKSPEMEYSATYDLSRSVPVEKWEKEFDEKFGDNLSLDGPFDKSYAKLVLAPAIKSFISQALQAARIEAKEEERNGIAEKIDRLIEDYQEIGKMLQGDSKTINIEKVHALYLAKSAIKNI